MKVIKTSEFFNRDVKSLLLRGALYAAVVVVSVPFINVWTEYVCICTVLVCGLAVRVLGLPELLPKSDPSWTATVWWVFAVFTGVLDVTVGILGFIRSGAVLGRGVYHADAASVVLECMTFVLWADSVLSCISTARLGISMNRKKEDT